MDSVKDELFYRWRYRGVPERKLAEVYQITRPHVEEIIREKVVASDPRRPDGGGAVVPLKMAA